MKKRIIAVILVCMMTVLGATSFAACTDDQQNETRDPIKMNATASIVVSGYEWGPAVSAVVVGFDGNVSGVTKDTFTVKTANVTRTVTDVYVSDAQGNPSSAASSYVTIELSVEYNQTMQSAVASPFTYDWMTTQKNTWVSSYALSLAVNSGKTFTAGSTEYRAGDTWSGAVTSSENRIVPQTASWDKDTYRYTGEGKDITLQRAAWSPEGAATDGGKNPLVIWLHGAGEGGTDIDIALLGNEVTALTDENDTNVQGYFQTENSAGAYVLALQTPTIWMDQDGKGTYNHQDESTTEPQESWYTAALWGAITSYVESNPDVDTSRIYLGGCSNGGYMTMNMMFEHGEYFAAFYPVCEAYLDQRISDDMIDAVKDYNIWFVQSANDPTVAPSKYCLPTFNRLIAAGAENVHLTLTEKVTGVDQAGAEYNGHWSWIYAFNDEVKTQFDNAAVTGVDYLVPANCTVSGNLWQWLAAQSSDAGTKDPAEPVATDTFEAENAVITNGKSTSSQFDWTTQQWVTTTVDAVPVIESGTEYTADGSDGAAVTNVGYFYGEGTKLTWTVTAAEECDAVITLRAASSIQDQSKVTDWQTGEGLAIASVDLSANQYVKLTVGGAEVALEGILPGITGLNWSTSGNAAIYKNFGTGKTGTVHLQKGENVIVLEATNASAGLNIDKLIIDAPQVLTYVPVDNSDRIQSGANQG